MTQLATILVLSIALVLILDRFTAGQKFLKHLSKYGEPAVCRSFILDILILLPLVGLMVEVAARAIKNRVVISFFPVVVSLFLIPIGIETRNVVFVTFGMLFVGLFFFSTVLMNFPRVMLYETAYGIFLAVSLSLYYDFLNLNFLTHYLGHPEAWGGNHFMWNSGVEVLGFGSFIVNTTPTYLEFFGFWNLLSIILFGPIYILVMVEMGTWLHGLLFGYTEKQTGISALFWERKTR